MSSWLELAPRSASRSVYDVAYSNLGCAHGKCPARRRSFQVHDQVGLSNFGQKYNPVFFYSENSNFNLDFFFLGKTTKDNYFK